ncbi:probable beta-hexosaminidase fdl [Euwallacea similis]|uniref:probable beta-hexosaminidase fdl n=1 Tax=Euwallacea similis TaxID=1736056 RepID=UPI00344C57CD
MQFNAMKELAFLLMFSVVLSVFVISIICKDENVQKSIDDNQLKAFSNKWICNSNKCEKSGYKDGISLTTCNMLCGDSPPLWPKPAQLSIMNKNSSTFLKEHIVLKIHSPEEAKPGLEELSNIFLDTLVDGEKYRLINEEGQIVKLNLHIKYHITRPLSTTNESYILYSQNINDFVAINIFADNYFGARNGLESLMQLIWYDNIKKRYRILHDIKITDQPKFSHRGLLLDLSRHYFPIALLKRAVDGMAASKLNVLHLHISDSSSFPLVLPHNADMAFEGAYDENSKYTADDIRDLVEYARKRGIRTVMEVDAPSHVAPHGWPKGEVLCDDPDLFKATLNPDNPHTLDTLQSVYEDLISLGADTETFHIGDDEVVTSCWRNTEAAKNGDLNGVWVDFSNKMIDRLRLANNGSFPKNIVLWSSPLTDNHLQSLSNQQQLVVQYWFGKFHHILDTGYKIIFSTVGEWYLDCGFGPWRKQQQKGSCEPYTDWKKFYKYRPWKDYATHIHQVLGGEVCLWTEQVSPDDLETRLWPRTAAFAERLWSDPEVFDQDDVYRRIDFHSRRLKARGLRVAAIWPQICSQFPERC